MSNGRVTDGPKGEDRSLKAALRRARLTEAEHTDVVVDLRAAELARLGVLADELAPVIGELPPDTDLIDCAIVPGTPPRLWIDMLGYVEMGHDKRRYRLVTETRDGRKVLLETADVKTMAGRITDYIAHRLIERERALESMMPRGAALPAAETARADRPAGRRSRSDAAAFWQVAFSFVLGLGCGVIGMIALALIVTR